LLCLGQDLACGKAEFQLKEWLLEKVKESQAQISVPAAAMMRSAKFVTIRLRGPIERKDAKGTTRRSFATSEADQMSPRGYQ
jgi:hypothetical protein